MLSEHFTPTHWWIAACLSGLALAAAVASLPSKPRAKLIAGTTVVLVTALYCFARGRSEGTEQALQLYILSTLPLAILRWVFGGWFRRQPALARAGEPTQEVKGRHTALFLGAFVAVVAAIVVLL
ncbi:hypothetical protein [Streptomyces sp. KS_5]|uniref:hypothetical protein n=1 Tax=Streptomyces sp. KS_5 TaxID=1881018 RepID=UPI00089A15E9|nr:hypothetical protein [Streptomyces sp. KS_5]SED36757.1 hypothetical protein SAMN05428938_4714 [Streptomyces sp. KS_5]